MEMVELVGKNLFDWSRFWHNQQLWNYGERFEIIGKRRATSLGSKAKKDPSLLQKLGNVVTESIFPYGKSFKLTIEIWIQILNLLFCFWTVQHVYLSWLHFNPCIHYVSWSIFQDNLKNFFPLRSSVAKISRITKQRKPNPYFYTSNVPFNLLYSQNHDILQSINNL